MEGVITSFRRGRHTVHGSQMIVQIKGVDKKEKTADLLKKSAVWTSPANKDIKGTILAAHGSKGAVRIKFDTGMPGQSVGQKVKIE